MFGCSGNLLPVSRVPISPRSGSSSGTTVLHSHHIISISDTAYRPQAWSTLKLNSLNAARNFHKWDRLSCVKSGRGVYNFYFKTRVSKLQLTTSTMLCCSVSLMQSSIAERDGEVFMKRDNVTIHENVCEEHALSTICENTVSVKSSPNILALSDDKPHKGEEPASSGCLDDDLKLSNGMLTDKEKLRRERISRKNRGRVPWNKGKKHKPETIELIRQRTSQAMLRPAVTEKLRRNSSKPMGEATKENISRALRKLYAARREMKLYQLECLKGWKNQVAEAARIGGDGEEEFQWNSYYEFKMKLNLEYAKELRSFESMKKHGFQELVGYSIDHRKSISDAMKEKWKNEDYRTKACTGRHNYLLTRKTRPNSEKKITGKRSKSLDYSFTNEQEGQKQPVLHRLSGNKDGEVSADQHVVDPSGSSPQDPTPEIRKVFSYVDPKASEKLEKLRRLQANRLVMEMKRKEAAVRARFLMMEAEKAAKALEAAAQNNKFAKASLAETRRLLAEAAQSIQTVESKKFNEVTPILQRHASCDGIDSSKASTSSQKRCNSSEAFHKRIDQSLEDIGELERKMQPDIIGRGDTFDLIDSWIIHENPEKFMTSPTSIRKFHKARRLSISQPKIGATGGSVLSLNSFDRESLTLPLHHQNLKYCSSISTINIPIKSNHIDVTWTISKKPKGSKKWHCGRLVCVENEEFC